MAVVKHCVVYFKIYSYLCPFQKSIIMDYQKILFSAKMLSSCDQARLISDLLGVTQEDFLSFRRQQFYDKQLDCPRCESMQYYKYGMDKGCQRFKCNGCRRTFTEFTGTWLPDIQLNMHKCIL